MTSTTTSFFIGVAGHDELFQGSGFGRAVFDARDGDDKVSARTNGLFDLVVYGGTGRDILEMGSGADTIWGDDPSQGVNGDPNFAPANFQRDAILGGGTTTRSSAKPATTSSTARTVTISSMAASATTS
jgi:hypothetical protein